MRVRDREGGGIQEGREGCGERSAVRWTPAQHSLFSPLFVFPQCAHSLEPIISPPPPFSGKSDVSCLPNGARFKGPCGQSWCFQ